MKLKTIFDGIFISIQPQCCEGMTGERGTTLRMQGEMIKNFFAIVCEENRLCFIQPANHPPTMPTMLLCHPLYCCYCIYARFFSSIKGLPLLHFASAHYTLQSYTTTASSRVEQNKSLHGMNRRFGGAVLGCCCQERRT